MSVQVYCELLKTGRIAHRDGKIIAPPTPELTFAALTTAPGRSAGRNFYHNRRHGRRRRPKSAVVVSRHNFVGTEDEDDKIVVGSGLDARYFGIGQRAGYFNEAVSTTWRVVTLDFDCRHVLENVGCHIPQ